MTINKIQNGAEATLQVEGRLDTVTAPELDKAINEITNAEKLDLDFAKLDYISSAGLRILLAAHKTFAKKGGMTVKNVNEIVADIFEVTGFNDILNIQ